jgi:acylphosphatase
MAEFWRASAQQIAKRVVLEGRVQGVGCRAQVQELVTDIGHISGFVRNMADGKVEIYVKGDDWRIEKMIEILRNKMKAPVQVERVLVEDLILDLQKINDGFMIRKDT